MSIWGCRFCGGRGCLACESAEPQAPEPLFTAHFDNPDEMKTLVEVFHREKIEHAFGPDGGGMQEIVTNLVVSELRRMREREA